MKRTFFIIINAVVIIILGFSSAKAQVLSSDIEKAKAFTQQFYDNYNGLYSAPTDKKHPECSCTVILKKHPEYFEPALLKALLADYDAQEKVKGEIVGLDFDPFLAAQDNGFKYVAGNVKAIGNKLLIEVHCALNSKSKKEVLASDIAVIAELMQLNGHWVFSNFIYPAEGKQKQSNLKDILSSLRKERAEYVKHK